MKVSGHWSKTLVALALIAFGAPQMVSAATTGDDLDRAAVHVNYSDLDLTSTAGLNVLYHRLSNATRSICGEQIDVRSAGSVKQLRKNKQCYDTVLTKSVHKVDNDKLEEIHNR